MLRAGLVDEALALRQKYGAVRPLDSVGYKEALQLVDGVFHPSKLGARIEIASHQFAKRQRTWFGKIAATRVSGPDEARAALERP
jgi:tRNA dimethylallyltransferase